VCNNEENIVSKPDFACIGDVATHCIVDKLCIAISEAQDFDLAGLFCNYWQDILTIVREVDEYDAAYALYLIELAECEEDPECTDPPIAPTEPEDYELKKNLVCGGTYTGCGDKTKTHKGIKRITVYYAYSRYLLINGFSDTAAGMVRKTNEFSIPTPLKEIENFADKYRTMGYESFKQTHSFLCRNKDVFTWFDDCDCVCDCGGKCDSKTSAKGYGFKSTNISKQVPSYDYKRIGKRYDHL
jgi:hypothetical protein